YGKREEDREKKTLFCLHVMKPDRSRGLQADGSASRASAPSARRARRRAAYWPLPRIRNSSAQIGTRRYRPASAGSATGTRARSPARGAKRDARKKGQGSFLFEPPGK